MLVADLTRFGSKHNTGGNVRKEVGIMSANGFGYVLIVARTDCTEASSCRFRHSLQSLCLLVAFFADLSSLMFVNYPFPNCRRLSTKSDYATFRLRISIDCLFYSYVNAEMLRRTQNFP